MEVWRGVRPRGMQNVMTPSCFIEKTVYSMLACLQPPRMSNVEHH